MYALHPGSLPPKGARDTQRIEVTADDLVRLYKLKAWEWIVWDPTDGYDWFDFIHLYPSYYGRYALTNGKPQPDLPDGYRKTGWLAEQLLPKDAHAKRKPARSR